MLIPSFDCRVGLGGMVAGGMDGTINSLGSPKGAELQAGTRKPWLKAHA